jgi:hypothetical protein
VSDARRRAEEAVANCHHLFYGCNECDPWGEAPSGACRECVADAITEAVWKEREECAKLAEALAPRFVAIAIRRRSDGGA